MHESVLSRKSRPSSASYTISSNIMKSSKHSWLTYSSSFPVCLKFTSATYISVSLVKVFSDFSRMSRNSIYTGFLFFDAQSLWYFNSVFNYYYWKLVVDSIFLNNCFFFLYYILFYLWGEYSSSLYKIELNNLPKSFGFGEILLSHKVHQFINFRTLRTFV